METTQAITTVQNQILKLGNPQSIQLMQCLASSNEVGLIVFEKNLSVASAIDGTKLKKLEGTIGEVSAITAICYLLNRFNTNFNVGKSLTPQQAAIIASDIVEKYPFETIEDILLMLKMVRQGIIGDGKDYKLDGQNILGKDKWMDQYLDFKYAEFERQKQKEKNRFIQADNAVEQFYAKRKAHKEAEENKRLVMGEIDEMVKSMDRQMLEDTIADWSKKPDMLPHLDYLKQKRRTVK